MADVADLAMAMDMLKEAGFSLSEPFTNRQVGLLCASILFRDEMCGSGYEGFLSHLLTNAETLERYLNRDTPREVAEAGVYVTPVLCPVCRRSIDTITHTDPEPGGMGALILGDSRRAHGEASPECTQAEAWIQGWVYGETYQQGPRMSMAP